MTSVIRILDSHSANQIAAGEVVERPASVVKELVENAIDAGAKHIDITIEGNGVPLIRVRDDGCGISASDLPLTVIRHATSKIRKIEDLDQLQTLGFRGEALPSIASVSHLEISSRPAQEAAGLCLTLTAGEERGVKEIGCPVGTSVTVRNLFFNTPARLKFLKSTATEFGLISDTIGRIALAHPEIAFSLTHPQLVVLQTSGRGDLLEAIGIVLGHATARQLLPVKAQHEHWQFEGYISPPDLVRSTKQAQTFIINGRIVRSPLLSRALEEGYHTLIPGKLHPLAVLNFQVPPFDYDVNVHPTKMDVRFKNEQELTEFISKSVYRTLISSKPVPSIRSQASSLPRSKTAGYKENLLNPVLANNPPKVKDSLQVYNTSMSTLFSKPPEAVEDRRNIEISESHLSNPAEEKSEKSYVEYGSLKEPTAKEEGSASQVDLPQYNAAIPGCSNLSGNMSFQTAPENQDILTNIWPLAQLFNTYILATDGEVLYMIDQHAAHERINYERLLESFKAADQHSQALLVPLPMEFTLQEEQVVLENLWTLNEMGFVLEQFGSKTYLLRGVPVQIGTYQADILLRQFIEDILQKNSKPSFEKLLEEWIYLLACKESIKAQDTLTLLEMEQLTARLSQTKNPYTCPHGRPTMIKMTRSELERRFYRS